MEKIRDTETTCIFTYAGVNMQIISEGALFDSISKYDKIFCSKFLTHVTYKLSALECKIFLITSMRAFLRCEY